MGVHRPPGPESRRGRRRSGPALGETEAARLQQDWVGEAIDAPTVPTLAVALVRIGQTGRGRRGRCGRSARADRFFLQALRRVECDTPVIVGLDGESQQSGSEPSPARCDRTVVRTAVVRCPLSPDGTCGCWIRSGSPTTAPGLPTTRARLPQCPAGSGRGAPCNADPVSRKRQKRERPWVTSPARDACYAASIAGNVTSQSSD